MQNLRAAAISPTADNAITTAADVATGLHVDVKINGGALEVQGEARLRVISAGFG